jgi:hypothetical protein
MRDALRTCLQIAGGLTEATRRRTAEAARELLDQAGIDVDDLQRKIGERIPPEVQTLTDELIASGRANRDLLIGLVREEVDKTLSRVGWIADEVTKIGVVLEALERRVRNLEADEPLQDEAASAADPEAAPVSTAPVAPGAGGDLPAKKAAPSNSVAARPVVESGEAPPAGAKAAKAPVKKAAAKKATPAAKPETAPAQATGKKTAAKKATPAAKPETAPAQKAAAKKTPVKKTAAKKATAKKTAAKPAAKKAAPAGGRAATGGPDTEAKDA